jgi:predicted homoserine dehydrogenase-like protein
MKSIGIGVIGAGVMGAEHARILASDISGAHLVAVADADPARAEAAARGGAGDDGRRGADRRSRRRSGADRLAGCDASPARAGGNRGGQTRPL